MFTTIKFVKLYKSRTNLEPIISQYNSSEPISVEYRLHLDVLHVATLRRNNNKKPQILRAPSSSYYSNSGLTHTIVILVYSYYSNSDL